MSTDAREPVSHPVVPVARQARRLAGGDREHWAGRGGLQRRCRFRPRGARGDRCPRFRKHLVRHRRLRFARARGARRLPSPGPGMGTALAHGADRRARRPRVRGQRCRSLLPLQGESPRRRGAVGAGRVGGGGARCEPRRPRGPSSRPGGRHRARRAASAGGRPVSPKTMCAPCRAGSGCGRGTNPRRPVWRRASPTALPSRSAPCARCPRPSRRCGPLDSANSASVTTATWLVSSSTETTSPSRCNGARGRGRGEGGGYCYVTLDLEGFRPATSTSALAGAPGEARAVGDKRHGGAVIDVRVKLTFPEDLVRRPFIAQLVRDPTSSPTSDGPTSTTTRAGSCASSPAARRDRGGNGLAAGPGGAGRSPRRRGRELRRPPPPPPPPPRGARSGRRCWPKSATNLRAPVAAAVPAWVERSLEAWLAAGAERDRVMSQAEAAGGRAGREVAVQLGALLGADVDGQHTTPLGVVRLRSRIRPRCSARPRCPPFP